MLFRRFVVIALSIAMLSATIPAPALALPTSTEVQIGKEYDKQITDSNVIVTDPLLNQWVNDISNKLWAQTARKDVPYSIKILDVADINAFSTLGGYIYINEGTLDFVQSDDELAGIIGHETGHIERRHAVTAQNKASILNVLFGIGSLFSPFAVPLRPDAAGRRARAHLARRRERSRQVRPDADGARRLRSRRDAHVHGAPRRARAREPRPHLEVPRRPPRHAEAAREPERRPRAQPAAAHRRPARRAGDPRLRHRALQHRRDEVRRRAEAASRRRDRALPARPVAARARSGLEGRAEPHRRGRKRLAASEGARRRADQSAARRRAPAEPAASGSRTAARAARRPRMANETQAVDRDRDAPQQKASTSSSRCARASRTSCSGCPTSRACSPARTRGSTR